MRLSLQAPGGQGRLVGRYRRDLPHRPDSFLRPVLRAGKRDHRQYGGAVLPGLAFGRAPCLADALATRGEAKWGDLGPRLITTTLRELGLMEHAQPPASCYPIHWKQALDFLDPAKTASILERASRRCSFTCGTRSIAWRASIRRCVLRPDHSCGRWPTAIRSKAGATMRPRRPPMRVRCRHRRCSGPAESTRPPPDQIELERALLLLT